MCARTIDGSWKGDERNGVWKRTDRRLIGSKEPSGNFCEAFSYIRFLFLCGSNYSIKTNRPIAPGRFLAGCSGCVELMSSRTNGITSLLVTCCRSFSKSVVTVCYDSQRFYFGHSRRSRMAILHNRFHIHPCMPPLAHGKRSIFRDVICYTAMKTSNVKKIFLADIFGCVLRVKNLYHGTNCYYTEKHILIRYNINLLLRNLVKLLKF